jgi:hypothetical protein
MGKLNDWIDEELREISLKLPTLVHNDPSSFSCGYNAGYKGALLDLGKFMDSIIDNMEDYPLDYDKIYKTAWDLD